MVLQILFLFYRYCLKVFKHIYLKYFLDNLITSIFLWVNFCLLFSCSCVCLQQGTIHIMGLDFIRCFVSFVSMSFFHGFIFLSFSHFSFPLSYYLSSLNSTPRGPQISSICYISSRISHFHNWSQYPVFV